MRWLVILRHVAPLALSFLRDRRRWVAFGRPLPRTDRFHDRRAGRLLDAIIALGPSFVKLGQVYAGRADLLPEPYASRLATLTDRVPPVPFDQVEGRLAAALGGAPATVFESFNQEPIAAGSLGLVYRARYQGRDVAVKVLRPGVRELVARDMAVARRLIRFLAGRVPDVHVDAMAAVVEEFSVRVQEEMDFRREAGNLSAVRRNFAGNPRVRIPEVVEGLSTGEVLVLEFMQGIRIDQLPSGSDGTAVVDRLIEIYLQMMLVDGLFHADPHPGNLLVAPDGALVLLDFGVVIPVPRERRKQIVDVAFAALRNDATGIADGFYALGVVAAGARRDQIEGLAHVLLDLAARQTTTQERIDVLTEQVLDTFHDWPVRLPSDLVYFARTAALIEGIGIRYDPYFNPIRTSAPVLFRMRGKLLDALSDQPLIDQFDWPTVIGYLAGRATSMLRKGASRLRDLLAS